MANQMKAKDKRELSARITAAERRKRRSEAAELRQQINPPQLVAELKGNQRARKAMIKGKKPINPEDVEIMRDMDNLNIRLLSFVLPKLKTVELQGGQEALRIEIVDVGSIAE